MTKQRNFKNILCFLILLCNLSLQSLYAQQFAELGLPFIQNYSPNDYGAFDQNWDTVQDSLGVLYFANGDGILTYDGVVWNLLELPNKASVFNLGISDTDVIYVGAGNELGYLESDLQGTLGYVSLLSKLPKKYHDFGQVWSISTKNKDIFFGSKKYIFKWDGTNFEIYTNTEDSTIYCVNNRLLKRREQGLMEFKNNEFVLVPNGAFFADKKIYAILPYDDSSYILVTGNHLYLYNGETIVDFKHNFTSFFQDNQLYTGIKLKDGTFAIGSIYKGVLVFDKKGERIHTIDQETALQSNGVLGLFQDRSGILWASLFSGISKIEVASPFSFFNEANNAPNLVFDFQRFDGKMYAGGPKGFFVLNKDSNRFEEVPGNFGMVWDLLLFEDKMLVGTGSAVYELYKNGDYKKILDREVTYLFRSKLNTNRVFIGNDRGLAVMYFENGAWTLEKVFNEIHYTVARIVETANGDLWLGLDSNKVAKLSFQSHAKNRSNTPEIRIFSPEDGLPDDIGKLYVIREELYFASDNKAFRYHSKTAEFIEDKNLFPSFGLAGKNVKINNVDENGIWLIEFNGERRTDQLLAVPQKDGGFQLKSLDEGRIMHLRGYEMLAEMKDSILWYKGKPGIVRHNLAIKTAPDTRASVARISQVLRMGDSLLFNGYATTVKPQIPFKNNQLRFQYGNPSFYDESKNQFQYLLEGFDEDWSPWFSETKKDYTNIPEGEYTFKVRSKNIFNSVSNEDSFTFSILAPWYRSWWAYIVYGIVAIGLIVCYSKWKSTELQKKNRSLEKTIHKRTLEIRQKNELLKQQTEQLVQLNESKTKLYSNITHEFRTPLTVILGMAETLKTQVKTNSFDEAEKALEMIRRNGKNLLQLVNEMLDLAKVESGVMTLNLVKTDAIPFVKYLSESFHSLAEARKINLTVYSEINALEMDIDVNKMASIISNLLSNAIKFTSENGKVIVHLNKKTTAVGEAFSIKVQDNGKGLSDNDINHLFDRFYQADNQESHYQKGTGIGLSLAKEFIELMHGTISVESIQGKGSTFSVLLPVTNTAIKKKDAKITATPISTELKSNRNKPLNLAVDPSGLPLVLIIEDNEDVAHYLRTCLQKKYQTIHALNGAIGIKMALEHIPDIVISDVMMPIKDGYEVCATLKGDERTDHIPVILLTAKVTTQDRLTGLTYGADAYLAKPFIKEELFTRLDQLILVRKKLIGKLEKYGLASLLKEKVENPQTKFLQQVIQIVHANLDKTDFGSAQLTEKMHLSESQIYRKLKAITDKSTGIFIRSVRLQKAKELLQTTSKTISEIAYETGFSDPSWFSRAFKEEFGIAPSDTRK